MAAPTIGVGYLIVNDILTDCAFALIEPSVNVVVPGGGITAGLQTVPVFDEAMYVGAQVVVGVVGTSDLEVVTITAVVPDTSFSGVFANSHAAGEPITGATFPVRQPTDPFFLQSEMLGYISQAMNDFLTAVPLAVVVGAVTVSPAAQNTNLPADCMVPQRVALAGYPLRETSQSNLDQNDFRWQQQAASKPYTYFRDVGLQTLGVWPRSNNTTPLELIYQQRSAALLGLADGFIIPDPFLIYVKYRVLEFAYSKDGEQRNPGLAKYWGGRFTMGCRIAKLFLDNVNDPNLQMADQA